MSEKQAVQSTKTLDVKAADNIRMLAAAMVEKAKSGHPGGAMGGADYIHILFSEFLEYDPSNLRWPFRDRFFLDPGHMSAMLYAQQTLLGNIKMDEIKEFRQWGSPTPGHPEIDVDRGIENTSGPLGMGHTFGIGAAIAERFLVERFGDWMAHKTYIFISDGGVQEEVSQGAGRTAGFLGLGNIIMFYDSNDIQLSSEVGDVMHEDTGKKYEAWGWHVITIDGNDHDAIRQAIKAGQEETERPTLIIGKTVMGKGAVTEEGEPYERAVALHGKPLGGTKASFEKTIENLGGNPAEPFAVFPEVAEMYQNIIAKKQEQADAKKEVHKKWAAENAALAEKLDFFLSGNLPDLDFPGIEQKANQATRNASGTVLSYLADNTENIIVSSADLSNSDKTDAFLKKTTSFKKGDFTGRFLQAGVSELTMAGLSIGMALHGGVIPACATFFVFSDYMKPALRLAALMEQQVIFIWTHDAFRVGEDGPTHQPVEQEAQIRLLEKLQNHSHKNGFLVLRPADSAEATISWKMALENTETPTGLILSRQNIQDLPALGASRYEDALQTEKGAYIVQDVEGTPDLILVGNGSEVATLLAGAEMARKEKNLKIRLVSVPSEGRFRVQDKAYQDSILPAGVPKLGLTAGLPVNLEGLVGDQGRVIGLNHFGQSAPYTVLDEKFGFTGENVYNNIVDYLNL